MSDYVSVWKQCIRRIGALPEDERERVVASISILFLKEAVRALKPAPQYKVVPKDEEIASLRAEVERTKKNWSEDVLIRAQEINKLRAEIEGRRNVTPDEYAELKRFRDREEKVAALLASVAALPSIPPTMRFVIEVPTPALVAVAEAANALHDFKVTP